MEITDRINTCKKEMDEKEIIRATEMCDMEHVEVVQAVIYFKYIRNDYSYIYIAPNVIVLVSNESEGIWRKIS